ncbi:hypothetical protein UK23_41875, partial [Lentzea aerocolonigenes]
GRNGYRGSQDTIFVERSLDGGSSWVTTAEMPGNTRSLVFDPVLPGRVYLGAYLINAFYVSSDGGVSFVQRAHSSLRGIKTIAPDPSGIWLADAGGLYRSVDAGVSLKQVLPGRMNSVLVDPRDSRHVVAVGQNSVFVSFDGSSFVEVPDVSSEQLSAIAAGRDGTLYLGSIAFSGSSKGVLRSVNGGRSWTVFGGPAVERGVEALLVSTDGRTLYAGTVSGSVHRRSLG